MKIEVIAASTGEVTLSGEQNIDGVSVVVGDLVLVKDQPLAQENWIYAVSSGAWVRVEYLPVPIDLDPGTSALVVGGITQYGSYWILDATSPIDPGVTPVIWRLNLSVYLTRDGTATLSAKTFRGEVQFHTNGERIGVTSGDEDLPTLRGTLHVSSDRSAGVGILAQCYWEGSADTPYTNNDVTLFETYNRTLSSSANRSWAASCSNAYHDIPTGVTDSGTRVGAIGWAVSVKGREGYEHRGTLASLHGLEGTAGFQGEGYAGAVITEAVGIRGLVYADNTGGVIQFARGGIFVSDGGASRIIDNIGVYARARNGDTNYSLYCDGGDVYNKDKLLNVGQAAFGGEFSQSNSAIVSRIGGNAIEFGASGAAGFASNLGSTAGAGYPFLAFNAEADTANTFRTRGKKGVVLSSDLAGSLIFSRLANANAGGQSLIESARLDQDGHLILKEAPILPTKVPANASAPGAAGEVGWDENFIYVCVATDTWKRTPLSTW